VGVDGTDDDDGDVVGDDVMECEAGRCGGTTK